MDDLMEYMKIQWADIHQIRNQEWKLLVIIVGIFYALINISPTHILLHIGITILGLVACGMGVYMGSIHGAIICSKLRVIVACEKELGIEADFFKYPFPIQGLIVLIYFFIASILGGWLIWLLLGKIWASFITFAVCFLISLITCIVGTFCIKKKIKGFPPVTFRKEEIKNE